jgi:DNA-binding CsgD family transcriptional regulator
MTHGDRSVRGPACASRPGVAAMLVGRDRELRIIASFLDHATDEGAALMFFGEPGVGKTILLDAAAEAATAAGILMLRAAGDEFENEAKFSGLSRLLRPVLGELGQLSDSYQHALSVALSLGPGVPSDRLVVSNAVLALLRQARVVRPVLIVVDDLHWLDRPSAVVLGLVARRLTGSRIGFLAAVRPGEGGLFEHGVLPSHEIRPLDEAAAGRLVEARFPELAARVRQRVLAEAQGNPLALLELPATLSGPQRSAMQGLPTLLPVNQRLQALFASRVSDLPGSARRLLLLAALDGSGDLRVLQAAAKDSLSDLSSAEQAQLVRVDPGTGRLTFRHPLIRSAVVGLAPGDDCRRAHRVLADQLADQPERRAWHLGEVAVEPDEQVAGLLDETAQRILRRADAVGAVSALLRAAELSPARSDRNRRLAHAAFVGASVTLEVSTVSPLLSQARQVGSESGTWLLTAAAAGFALLNGDGDVITAHRLLAQAIKDQTRPYRISDPGFTEAVSALFVMCWLGGRPELWAPFRAAISGFTPDAPRDLYLLGQTYADPVRTAAAVLPEVDAAIASLRSETDHLLILTISSTAHFTDRQPGCREALRRVVREGRQGSGVTPLITALDHLCLDGLMTGRWDEAQELADEGLKLCLAHGYLRQTWTIRYRQALIAAGRGTYDAADALTAEMLQVAAPRRIGQADLAAHHVGSVAALGRGDFDDAYQHAAAISPAGVLASHVACALWVLLDLVEAAVRTGRHAEAVAHVAAMREADIGTVSPRLALITAATAAMVAPDDQATARFEEALAVPDADQWPFDLARVHLLYGEWLRRARSTVQARAHLNAALDAFRRLGAQPWQVRAGNELRATGLAARSAQPGAPESLAPLDREIGGLAAAGLTNKQIGERLCISHRTVAAHLYQLFPRLGITSRAALRDALDALETSDPGD